MLSYRLISYEDWPRASSQKPSDLAEAGFFYSGIGDCVTCFSCGVGLKDWEVSDVAWEEHVRFNSECCFLKNVKGEEFIKHFHEKTLANQKKTNSKETKKEEERVILECKKTVVKESISKESNALECQLCCANNINIALIPCGHMLCDTCALNLNRCPYCRASFTCTNRIFFS